MPSGTATPVITTRLRATEAATMCGAMTAYQNATDAIRIRASKYPASSQRAVIYDGVQGRTMRKEQNDVKEFMQAFGQEVREKPELGDYPTRCLRHRLMEEEVAEYYTAATDDDLPGIADALGDQLYILLGTANYHGIDLEPVFNEIHAANMRKLGGPKRADGKQLKPDGWVGPDIGKVLEAQQ